MHNQNKIIYPFLWFCTSKRIKNGTLIGSLFLSVCSSVKIILTLIDLRLIKIALSEIQVYRPLEHRTIQIKEKIGKVKFISYLLAPFILNMYKYWRT